MDNNRAFASHRATHESNPAVSTVPVGIANAEDAIPSGFYCYQSIDDMDGNGFMKIHGACPYWEKTGKYTAYCHFLKEADNLILFDQVKICGVKDDC